MTNRSVPPKNRQSLTLVGVLIGLALGLGGGLFYAWAVNPVVSANVAPWQLNRQGQENWIIAASVAWARDGDLLLAANQLNELRLNDAAFQRVADLACDLARTSYARTDARLTAIRSMVRLAASQGKPSCAADLIQVNTPVPRPTATLARATATFPPVASKTPTPEPGLTFTPATALSVVQTSSGPARRFSIVRYEPFCNVRASGIIEVSVTEPNGTTGVRGIQVQVAWPGGQDRFFTGLKPDRDDGFADFNMAADVVYTVTLPGQSDVSNELSAQACSDRQNGGTAITSYRVYFRRAAR